MVALETRLPASRSGTSHYQRRANYDDKSVIDCSSTTGTYGSCRFCRFFRARPTTSMKPVAAKAAARETSPA